MPIPKVLVINTPHTLQGTRGFTTVPESSNVRERSLLGRLRRSYIGLNVFPASKILRYCSPIMRLTPAAVRATANLVLNEELRMSYKWCKIRGIIPKVNSRPPKLSANMTIVVVKKHR